MTDKDTLGEAELEQLFALAKSEETLPTADLLARIISDADDVAGIREFDRQPVQSAPGIIERILDALGGWPAMAGLTTATVAGVWIGLVSPEILTDVADGLFLSGVGSDLGDFMPALSDFADEG